MDISSYILGKQAGGGGGGEAILINKSVDANGTYNASADSADGYKKVEVAVPNSYAAGDEGKVVSNGALVAQGSDTVTENGTYDTTLVDEVEVNVQGGGIYLQQLTTTPVEKFVDYSITALRQSGFQVGLSKSIALMNCTSVGQDAFGSSNNLETLVLPKLSTIGFRWTGYSRKLKTIDTIKIDNFIGNDALDTVILRKDTIVSMNGTWLNDTKFKNGGAGGDIYIPKSLYDHLGDGTANDYKAATNWATYDGYSTITWHAIEGSYYETHYADGTVIS